MEKDQRRREAGHHHGQTDDFGYNIAHPDGTPLRPQPVKDKWTPGTMHVHDMNATILHLLGIDHRRLTTRYQGRDFRLTDVHGQVMHNGLPSRGFLRVNVTHIIPNCTGGQ